MIRAIVTDIEGTTSDIRFVHDVLFPYARERLAAFVTAQQYAEPVKSILDNLRDEISAPHASVSDLINVLFTFMDEDRKSTALKALQGIIWQDGYVNGDFTGHLYPDVLPALEKRDRGCSAAAHGKRGDDAGPGALFQSGAETLSAAAADGGARH
ncbi:acireductone synthase, partial [Enterobacter hormaechei subsp. steigerwaltii]|nr:acireductone synthase [Enterobacter hormaechei subsp. steigerwaltii]